jgi:hypothetical protein
LVVLRADVVIHRGDEANVRKPLAEQVAVGGVL